MPKEDHQEIEAVNIGQKYLQEYLQHQIFSFDLPEETRKLFDMNENSSIIANNIEYASNIVEALLDLHEANAIPTLLNDENRAVIAAKPEYASRISMILVKLYWARPTLLNDENRTLIKNNARYVDNIAGALNLLHPQINNQLFHYIASNARYARDIAYSFIALSSPSNAGLQKEECYELIMASPQYSGDITSVLIDAYHDQLDRAVITRTFIEANASYFSDIARALTTLRRAHATPTLVNNENFKYIVSHAQHSADIARIISLRSVREHFQTPDALFSFISNHIDTIADIAKALYSKKDNKEQIVQYIEQISLSQTPSVAHVGSITRPSYDPRVFSTSGRPDDEEKLIETQRGSSPDVPH